MRLHIKFAGGSMNARGDDPIGAFTCSGLYSEDTGDVAWTKKYVAAHDVNYKGVRDGRGIWGNWNIGYVQGGFHIWPDDGEENASEHTATEVAELVTPIEMGTKPVDVAEE